MINWSYVPWGPATPLFRRPATPFGEAGGRIVIGDEFNAPLDVVQA